MVLLWLAYMVTGLLAGMFSALLGVGGGIILLPAMTLLFKVDMHRAAGTSLAVILPIALIGIWRHNSLGNVDARMAVLLGAGGAVGALIGAALADALPEPVLRRLFGALMLVMALRLLAGR